MTTAPRMAMAIPITCFLVGASRSATAEMLATTAGWRLTRVTEAAMVVRRIDAFHAQKWSASETPPAPASASSRFVTRLQSRHSPLATRNEATMTSEKPSRQAAIAKGSALESRTSGPANEIPSSENASTQNGLFDMQKKEPVRIAPALFREEP
jgi:hypothetical protein